MPWKYEATYQCKLISQQYDIDMVAITNMITMISNKNLHRTSWYLTMWCNATLAKIFEMCTSWNDIKILLHSFTCRYHAIWWNATIDKHLKCLRYDIKSLHRNFTCWYLIIANLHDDKTWYYVFHAMSWTNITNTWLWYFSFLLMTKGEKYVDDMTCDA